jgi:hypothetical protein
VIGLTTFGSLENTGGLAAGLNFAVPVAILYEFLDSVNPGISQSTRLFSQGLWALQQGHYRTALDRFEEVQKYNSHYPGLYTYIASCQENIRNGRGAVEPVTRLLIIVSVLLALTGVVAILRARRSA